MDRPFVAILAASFFSLFCLTTAASGRSGWPQIGYGPGHTGYNPTETVINSGNVASLTKTAVLSTPGEISEPIMVSGGIAYVNSIGSNALYAFDVATGQQLWTFSGTNLDAARGIAVAGDRVLVTCAIDNQHAGLCALKAKTGKLLWSWAYEGFPSSPQSPPAVSGGVVYFEEFETYGDWLTALDTKTGTVLWQFGYCQDDGVCDALGQNAPAIDGSMLYVGCNANYLTMNCYQCDYTIDAVALNETTGSIMWDSPMTQTLNGQYSESVAGPPAIRGKEVFSVLACCDASNDSGFVQLNAMTGQIRWHAELPVWLNSSPSLVNDVAFIQCSHGYGGGTLCAYDTTDGSFLWNSPDPGVTGSAAPSITGGLVYGICGYNDACLYTPQ